MAEDPRDLVGVYLLHLAQYLSVGAEQFVAIYLVSYEPAKSWPIIGFLHKTLSCYPTALIGFGLVIIYQLYRICFTNSAFLIFLTEFDSVATVLNWCKYDYLKRHISQRL